MVITFFIPDMLFLALVVCAILPNCAPELYRLKKVNKAKAQILRE
jgi:hypothetical protein